MKSARQKCHVCDMAYHTFKQFTLGHHKPASQRNPRLLFEKENDIINIEKLEKVKQLIEHQI